MVSTAAEAAIDRITTALAGRVESYPDAGFSGLRVSPADLPELMLFLRDKAGMNYLANLTATDLKEDFELTYHLYAIPDNGLKFAVKTRVSREAPQLPSVFSLYPTADWQEREVFDLMGVRFSGHPNLVRVLLPDEFVGHPLRKDFKKEV